MGRKSLQFLKGERGQAAVEYILLLVVISSLVATVLNSQRFREFLGPNSAFFTAVKDTVQFSYRHGLQGVEDETDYNSGNHPTYINEEENKTRFFLPTDRYP